MPASSLARLTGLTLAGCMLGMTPAGAGPTAKSETAMGTTVPAVTLFGAITVINSDNATFSARIEGGAIVFSLLADPNTARAMPAHINLTFSALSNGSQTVRLLTANGGLKPESGAAGSNGFGDRVDYAASMMWGSQVAKLSTDGKALGSAELAVSGAQTSSISLDITLSPGSRPLIAGAYSDVLTIAFIGTI